MRDVNSPLQKVYYDALNGNLDTMPGLPVPVYEDYQPDSEDSEMFVVLTGRRSFDTSTKNSLDVSAQIQVTVNSRKLKYNNRQDLNFVCNQILEILKPSPDAVLDMSAFNMQMLNLMKVEDNERDYGTIDDQAFVSRNIIFEQDIFIK